MCGIGFMEHSMANSLDSQYQQLLQDIIDFGVDKQDRTGTGTKSIFGYTIHHNMSWGFPLLTTKKVPFKTMATELMWFLMGDTNIKYLVDNNCHIWDGDAYKNYSSQVKMEWEDGAINELCEDGFIVEDFNDGKNVNYRLLTKEEFINKIKMDDEFANNWGELGPIYGKQWRQWQKYNGYHLDEPIDQIANLINELKTNPDSRRLMVSAWNVAELEDMVLPPCHHSFQLYSVEKEGQRYLSLLWNQRSIDSALGLPFNIASYGLLLEMIAREVNMIPEHLIGHLGDCHLYSDHLEGAKEQINREPRELPRLHMSSGHNFRAALAGKADEIDLNDFMLIGYDPHPTIKFPLSN
jgi:thymidylate synthase